MLIAIISDTHMPRGARRLPGRCVELLRAADLIVHAGDFIGAPVLRELESYGELVAVHGNVDEPRLQRQLPRTRTVELEGGVRLGMIHDAAGSRGRLEWLRSVFPDADAVVFGHSHSPMHETAADRFQIFNPGSPTERRRAPAHTMGLAHVRDGRLSFELIALD